MPHREGRHIELERTFLARYIPAETISSEPASMLDVYVPEDLDAHAHIRLRRSGDHYEITKKMPARGGDASALVEQTIHLSADEFNGLAVSKRRIEKDRY